MTCGGGLPAVQYATVKCSAVQWRAVQREEKYSALYGSAVQCSAVHISEAQFRSVKCRTLQCSSESREGQRSTRQCSAVQCRKVQCGDQRKAEKYTAVQCTAYVTVRNPSLPVTIVNGPSCREIQFPAVEKYHFSQFFRFPLWLWLDLSCPVFGTVDPDLYTTFGYS